MLEYFKRNQLKIAIVITLVSFLFVLGSQTGKQRIENSFVSLVQTIIYPFQVTSDFISSTISSAWYGYVWLVSLRKESEKLQKTIARLEEENARYKEIAIAHDRLLDSLEFKKKDKTQKVFAEVIAEAKEGYSKILIINKGSIDSIQKNFAVVAPQGVIGKIQSISRFHATVQLIIDSHSEFPVLIQRTRTKAILQGTPEGKLLLTLVPRNADLALKDWVITSGISGIFPKGIVVGRIEKINTKEYGLFQDAILTPSVDFSKIEEVFVVIGNSQKRFMPFFQKLKE